MMTLDCLLQELITISKASKTDFAISMHMTPSGVSKLLSGKHLPSPGNRKSFARQAADYFAEKLFAPKCYLKLTALFPALYDFNTRDELHAFLNSAVEYSLDQAYMAGNAMKLDHADRGFYFMGHKPALNQLCLMLSLEMLCPNEEPLELYSSLPFFQPIYAPILDRLEFFMPKGSRPMVVHHYFSPTQLRDAICDNSMEMLALLSHLEQNFDVHLWRTEEEMGQSFLLLKGRWLLLFNHQLDGTPMLIPVHRKRYLAVFYESLAGKSAQSLSVNQAETLDFFRQNPAVAQSFGEEGFDSVFNFTSVGYMLRQDELERAYPEAVACGMLSNIFSKVLSGKTQFYVSLAAMERFTASGMLTVPLLGPVYLPPEERIPYLQRLSGFLSEETLGKVKVLGSELSNLSLLCGEHFSWIYIVDDSYRREKFHVFATATLRPLLDKIVNSTGSFVLDLSPDLWQIYQEELQTNHS